MWRMSVTRVRTVSITRASGSGGRARPSPACLRPPRFDRALAQQRVREGEAGHRLGEGHDAGAQARIVAALDRELALLAVHVHGLLPDRDGGGRLDRDPRHDRLARRDASQNSARVIRREPIAGHTVVHFRAALPGGGEALADLEALYRA